MSRETTIRLHKDIKKEFTRLSNIKANGVKKFSVEYVLSTIAFNFYKSPKTIENIVFNRTTSIKSSTSVLSNKESEVLASRLIDEL